MVLRFNMTSGFSLEPSPTHAKTTVRRFFSFPVVRIFTVFSLIVLTVQFDGMKKIVVGSSLSDNKLVKLHDFLFVVS